MITIRMTTDHTDIQIVALMQQKHYWDIQFVPSVSDNAFPWIRTLVGLLAKGGQLGQSYMAGLAYCEFSVLASRLPCRG